MSLAVQAAINPWFCASSVGATNKLFEYGPRKNVASMMPGFQVRDCFPELPAHLVDLGRIRVPGRLRQAGQYAGNHAGACSTVDSGINPIQIAESPLESMPFGLQQHELVSLNPAQRKSDAKLEWHVKTDWHPNPAKVMN